MKKNTVNKYIIILIIAIILIAFLAPQIAAGYNIDVNSAKPNALTGPQTIFTEKIGIVVGFIQVIGSIVSVVVLIVIGIKYIMGSVEEKADYKKTLVPYLIGAILLFASSNIVQAIYDWSQAISA